MLAPAVIYVIALVAVPFFLAIALSLSEATVGNPTIQQFVGLDNFISVVYDAAFMFALRNSIIITVATLVLLTILTILQVELLARDFPGKRLAQILLILPWAMPVALAAVGWLWLLDLSSARSTGSFARSACSAPAPCSVRPTISSILGANGLVLVRS